jgi:nitrite reductase (NADH) small subunit
MWRDVCGLDEIVPETGVAALVAGRQIAVVRAGGQVYALDNFDPASGAHVLARGIVGDRDGSFKIASPIFKHCYELSSGRCLEDPALSVAVYPARVRAGRVEVEVG